MKYKINNQDILLSGWEYVEGVELTPEYIPIGEKRLNYWVK